MMNQRTMQDLMILYFEKILEDFERIVFSLNNTDFQENRKTFLAKVYVNNRISKNNKNSELGDLICSSAITNNFSFEEQKKLLGYYLYDNSIYNVVVKGYNENKKSSDIIESIEEEIKKKLNNNEIDYSNSLYVLTTNLDIYCYRSSKDLEKLMYYCNMDKEKVLFDIVNDKKILKNRSVEEQLEFMRLYLNNPSDTLKNLIINNDYLEKIDGVDHIKVLNEYLLNDEKEEKIENSVNK